MNKIVGIVLLAGFVIFSGITTFDYLKIIDENNSLNSELTKMQLDYGYALKMLKLSPEQRDQVVKEIHEQNDNMKLI
jgi:hypothetical protein